MIDTYKLAFKGRKYGINFTVPLTVKGGPFREIMRELGTTGKELSVCLKGEASREEVKACDLHIPITDFSTPEKKDETLVYNSVGSAVRKALDGGTVYVGCMGGTGRTGLFMALMAKASGIKDPIYHVRENYRSHAVETRDQEAYVKSFKGTEALYKELNDKAFRLAAKKKLRSLWPF